MNTETSIQSGKYTYILGVSIVAAVAGLLFGFDTGVISGALQFISATFHITEAGPGIALAIPQYSLFGLFTISGTMLQEFIVAAVPAGALIGSIASSPCANKLGRRGSIILTALLFIIGTIIAALAIGTNMLLGGRLLMGFAVGLSAMVAPMYLSEVSPPEIRGAIVFLYQMAVTVGILMAFIVNYVFHIHGGWRAMFGVGVIPAIFLFIGMLMLPKSPRWLMQHAQSAEAITVLHKLRGTKDVKEEVAEIRTTIEHKKSKIRDLFSGRIRILVIITFGLFVFQQ